MSVTAERVRRSPVERVVAAVVAVAMGWVLSVLGWRELVYAFEHPEERDLLPWVPVVLFGAATWLLFSPSRRAGFPVALAVVVLLGALTGLGTLFLIGLASAFRH